MARTRLGRRAIGGAAAATLLAAAPLMAACSDGSDSSSDAQGSSPSPSKSAAGGSGSSSGNGSGAAADRQSTVASAVGAWVGAVIEKDVQQACLLSTVPGSDNPPKANSPRTCKASTTKQMARGIKSLSTAFSPKNASGKPTVQVDAATPKGNTAVVPAEKINVDGESLKTIMLTGSKGVDANSFDAKVKADRIGGNDGNDENDGKWYVNDFDMDLGH